MFSFVFRVITFAGSAAIFGFLTREFLRRRAELDQSEHKNLPAVAEKKETYDTIDVEVVTDDD